MSCATPLVLEVFHDWLCGSVRCRLGRSTQQWLMLVDGMVGGTLEGADDVPTPGAYAVTCSPPARFGISIY